MMMTAGQIINKAEEIASEGPSYCAGQDGQNGQCDDAGLIVGAIRRAGGQWRGPVESNNIARKGVSAIEKISDSGPVAGEVVFRAYEPWHGGYDLASKYERDGDYYTGDLTDYYHIGLVESVNPLRIRHMAFGKMKMDTKLDKWTLHAKLRKVDYGNSETPKFCQPPKIEKKETVPVQKEDLEALDGLVRKILGKE